MRRRCASSRCRRCLSLSEVEHRLAGVVPVYKALGDIPDLFPRRLQLDAWLQRTVGDQAQETRQALGGGTSENLVKEKEPVEGRAAGEVEASQIGTAWC